MSKRRARRLGYVLALLSVLLSGQTWVWAAPGAQDAMPVLVYGQTVEGEISPAQPSVFYAFDASANDVVTITMIVTAGALDPFLVLNTAERMPLVTDDNSGGGLNARLTFVIPSDGRYIIQATQAGGVPPEEGGTFTLNLTAAVDGPPQPAITSTPSIPETPAIQGDSVRLVMLEAGGAVRDTLSQQVALRWYWFEAEGGEQVVFTPEMAGSFQPLYALYDGAFQELGRSGQGVELHASLPQDGIYFLAVALPDPAGDGGAYSFTFDRAPNPATEGNYLPLSYGETVSGNVDDTISAVTYRFYGSAGDTITVTMSRAGGDLNSYLYLLDADGQLLFEDNDSGGGNGDARLVYTLPYDGAYLIVATRLGQMQGTSSGSYVLMLQSDAPSPQITLTPEPTLPPEYVTLTPITYGETVEGELSNARYMDFYVFLGHEGDPITIEMRSLNADQPNGLDPLLILLDDGRIPLVENDDIVEGQERDARIEYTLPKTAYYAIVATRFEQETGTSAGPYTLTLEGPGGQAPAELQQPEDTSPLGRLSAEALPPDVPVQGTFEGGARLYTFYADAGDTVDLTATSDAGDGVMLVLADQNLSELVSSGMGALSAVTIPKAGDYGVLIAPRVGPIVPPGGTYTLALTYTVGEAVPQDVPQGPRAIAYGDVVNGVIDDEHVSQIYTFNGLADQRVRITMEATPGSELDCYLELQDADGATVDANDDIDPGQIRDSQIVVDLPADGEYTIIASRYVGPDAPPTSGRYRLMLELVDENAVTGVSSMVEPLGYGQTVVGELNDDQYLLFYVFEGQAGDVVTIEVEHLSGNLDSVLHLYRAEGDGWVEIASNDDSPVGGTYAPLLSRVVLPQSGKYLVAINRYGLESEHTYGTFSLTLTREE